MLKRFLALAAGILGFEFCLTARPQPDLAVPMDIPVIKDRVIDDTGAAPIKHGIVVIANGRVQCVRVAGKYCYPPTRALLLLPPEPMPPLTCASTKH